MVSNESNKENTNQRLETEIKNIYANTSFRSGVSYKEQMEEKVITLLQTELEIEINDAIKQSSEFQNLLGKGSRLFDGAKVNSDLISAFMNSTNVKKQLEEVQKLDEKKGEEGPKLDVKEGEQALDEIQQNLKNNTVVVEQQDVKKETKLDDGKVGELDDYEDDDLDGDENDDLDGDENDLSPTEKKGFFKNIFQSVGGVVIGKGTVDSFRYGKPLEGILKVTFLAALIAATAVTCGVILAPLGLTAAIIGGAIACVVVQNATKDLFSAIGQSANERATKAFTKSFNNALQKNPSLETAYKKELQEGKKNLQTNRKTALKSAGFNIKQRQRINKHFDKAERELENQIKMKYLAQKITYKDGSGNLQNGPILEVVNADMLAQSSTVRVAYKKQFDDNKLGQRGSSIVTKGYNYILQDFNVEKYNKKIAEKKAKLPQIEAVKSKIGILEDKNLKITDYKKIPEPTEEYKIQRELAQKAQQEKEKMTKVNKKDKQKITKQSQKNQKTKQQKKRTKINGS